MLISIRTWPSFKHQPFVRALLFEGAGFKMRVHNTGLKPSRHDASQPKGNLPKVATKSRCEKPVAILQPVPVHRAALRGRTWHFSLLSPVSPCTTARPPRPPSALPMPPASWPGGLPGVKGSKMLEATPRDPASLFCPTHAPLGAPQFSQVSCHLTAPDHSLRLLQGLTASLSHFNSAGVQHKSVTVCTASKLVSSLPTHSAVTFTASETRQREWAFLAPNKSREL